VQNVFVETNWVVDYAAPAHHKVPEAGRLLNRAADAEIRIYLPAICISEARRPLQEKYQVRSTADRVRKFLRWARQEGALDSSDEEAVRRVLDRMESKVRTDLDNLDNVLQSLRNHPGLEVFDLTQAMLEKCTELSFLNLGLEPFDQAILAAVLVKADELMTQGFTDLAFCEPDSDLQPWSKSGPRKDALTKLYDDAEVWVYEDFHSHRS
jgi:predicted nucleic acid-binding protein